MDLGNFSREELYAINIHELRKLGQQVGVKSPSSLNKEDLVENIYSIITGIQMPYKQKDKRGRPTKARVDDKFFYDIKNLTTFGSAQNSLGYGSVASQASEYYFAGDIPKHLIKRGTFIKTKNAGKICKYPYVESEQDAYIGQDLINDYNLRDFDIVDYCLVDSNAIIKDVSTVIAVNGKKISEDEVIFNRLGKCGKEGVLVRNFKGNNEIVRGSRVLVFSDVPFDSNEACQNLCDKFSKLDNAFVIALSLDKQQNFKFNKNNVLSYSSNVIDNPIVSFEACNKALLQAKIQTSIGDNVVIIIDNIETLIKAFKANVSDNAQMHIKRLLFTANTFENGASITIVCLAPNKFKTDSALNDYLEYFDTIIK